MGERKVLNKYYPPDFDPALLPRRKRPKNEQIKVRMMLPMSICCNTCGEYLYRGKKFNARKETVEGEEYLGIKIFRLYIKCVRCSSELTIKTDPERSDYVCEFGASRNFEPWREKEKQSEQLKQMRAKEEKGDAMKALENKTMDSKTEMDILDALDELKSLNARHERVDPDQLLDATLSARARRESVLRDEDEEELKKVVFHNSANYVRRLPDPKNNLLDANNDNDNDDDEDNEENLPLLTESELFGTKAEPLSTTLTSLFSIPEKPAKKPKPNLGVSLKVVSVAATKKKEASEPKANVSSLVDDSYSSD